VEVVTRGADGVGEGHAAVLRVSEAQQRPHSWGLVYDILLQLLCPWDDSGGIGALWGGQ